MFRVAATQFPPLIGMWAKWINYACDNEAIAGRDTSRCDKRGD